jgi:hypothetical protein
MAITQNNFYNNSNQIGSSKIKAGVPIQNQNNANLRRGGGMSANGGMGFGRRTFYQNDYMNRPIMGE